VSRLVIVSNRVAVAGTEAPQAGGLAVAVNEALKEREGIWFGWSGRVAEDGGPAANDRRREHRTFITLGQTMSIAGPICSYRRLRRRVSAWRSQWPKALRLADWSEPVAESGSFTRPGARMPNGLI
jgi:hypothetical protein